MDAVLALVIRITPALVVGYSFLSLLPKTQQLTRCLVHIGVFAVVRDTFTPLGLWVIETHPEFVLRLPNDSVVLTALTLGSVLLVTATLKLDSNLASQVAWIRKTDDRGLDHQVAIISAVAAGFAGALIVALPLFLLTRGALPINAPIVTAPWPLLLVFSLAGNCYEELLFRGFFQECLQRLPRISIAHASLTSAAAFSFAHSSLATATTDSGAPLLLFCLWEGYVAARLYASFGLVAAALAHGGGIFLISGAVSLAAI